jgi:hypothetical protein
MNIRQSFRTSSFLVAALTLVLASQPTPLVAGGSLGGIGAATQTVGGLADGAKSTVGSITGATDGAVSALGSATGHTDSTAGRTSTHPGYTPHGHRKVAITAKLISKLLKVKAGVFVLDKRHQLVRINAGTALDHILRAKVKVYVLDSHGNLVRVAGKVALAGIKAKAKVYVLDDHDVLRAKVIVAAGGKKGLKAKLGAKVGTVGAVVKVGLSLGGKHKPGTGGNGSNGNGGNGGANDGSVGAAVAGLSAGERGELRRKCPSVLATPASYDPDAVRVCRVLVQLSGL